MEYSSRKQIRLKQYDYSTNGRYYITICTHNRKSLFYDRHMRMKPYGMIVKKHIQRLSNLYEDVCVDKYCVMPNHIHMIVGISRERIVCVPPSDRSKMELAKIIQSFKSSVTKEIREIQQRHAYNACPTKIVIWQSRYYEHVIRDEEDYLNIWQYIDQNPLKWELDEYYHNNKE